STVMTDGMITKLSKLWPSPLETCYLLDAQLANLMVPVRGREDEPDDVVTAAALGLHTIITAGADLHFRQAIPPPSLQAIRKGEGGPFASLGIASFCIDHPRLHKLMRSWLLCSFLAHALPPTKGEAHIPGDAGTLCSDSLEAQIQQRIDKA